MSGQDCGRHKIDVEAEQEVLTVQMTVGYVVYLNCFQINLSITTRDWYILFVCVCFSFPQIHNIAL